MTARPPRDNLRGVAWLIADMSLNIWALSIVKWLGAGYPATQIVFIRALTGLILISPLIWPPFRELQPQPRSSASMTVVWRPAFAGCSAHCSPV